MIDCCCPEPERRLWTIANAQIPQGPVAEKSMGWKNDVIYRKFPEGWERRWDGLSTYVARPIQLNGETYEIVFREQRHVYGSNYSVSLFKDQILLTQTRNSNTCSTLIFSSDESKMALFDAAIRATLHPPPKSVFEFGPMFPYGPSLF